MSFTVWEDRGEGNLPVKLIEGTEAICLGFLSGASENYGTTVMLGDGVPVKITNSGCDCPVYEFDEGDLGEAESKLEDAEAKCEGLEEKLSEKDREIERLTALLPSATLASGGTK